MNMTQNDYDGKVKNIYRYSTMLNNLYQEKMTKQMGELAEEFHLNLSMKFSYYFVMCELYHEDVPMHLTELSKRIGVKLPNISNQVNELIRGGLLEQVYPDENKRRVSVQLSQTGKQYSDALVPQIEKITYEVYGPKDMYDVTFAYFEKLYKQHFED